LPWLTFSLAVIAEASIGIGAAIAENLASKGASLILNYTSDSSKQGTYELLDRLQKSYAVSCLVVQADLGSVDGPRELIKNAKASWAAHDPARKFQLDIIVNNAGVAVNDKLPDIKIDDFDFAYHVNVRGPLLLMQAAQPYLPSDRSGRIINISSISSSAGFLGQSIYGGTKAALEAMTRTWARELAENCTVNAINPGPVKTSMWWGNTDEFMEDIRPFMQSTPLQKIRLGIDDRDVVEGAEKAGGRPAYVGEIAGVVAMLCGVDAAWVTGQVVSANGGMRFGTG
jgi:NAD(P)-dependent dehydrogenase (short-subunit alcohol dehydrogenase family)